MFYIPVVRNTNVPLFAQLRFVSVSRSASRAGVWAAVVLGGTSFGQILAKLALEAIEPCYEKHANVTRTKLMSVTYRV